MRRKNTGKFKVVLFAVLLLALFLSGAASVSSAADTDDDYLSASGNALFDASGNPVRLTGIAWFGFETQNQVYHGLWSVKMEDILDTVADQGFNVLRVPLCVQLVNQWRSGNGGEPGSVNYDANPALEGLSSLQILDASIAYCKRIGLKVMLDMHRVVNAQMLDAWYTDGYPPGDFEACWQWLAQHYAGDDTVIAMDLFNEPHGVPGDVNMVKWDESTDPNNWKHEAEKVADLVLDENPGLLVVVEGVEATPRDGYTYAETNSANYDFNWWGGNLRRVKDFPVDLGSRQSQVVYSPHDYGPSVWAQPWFYPGFTQVTLTADCWEPNWLYIVLQGLAPVLVGEWGGRMDGGDNQQWMGYLADTIAQYELNHTFWCVNPNSGDTGGILLDDWQTVDTTKYHLIEPTLWQDGNGKFIGLDHQVNLGANGTHVGAGTTPTGNNSFITPSAATFDKNPSAQADIAVTMTLNGNTLDAVRDSSGALVAGSDYSAAGTLVTISKSYLADQAEGTVRLTFDFSAGLDPVLTVTLTDSSTDDHAPAPCGSAVSATLPLAMDGAGEYCWVTSGDISTINSWNMQQVEINGQDFTNTWSDRMPARIDGYYYIHYVGTYAWSHLEVSGSGESTETVAAAGVSVVPAEVSVSAGTSTTLRATVTPAGASNPGVSWSSSATGVATVNADGVVTGVAAGSATIAATTADGGFTAACTVTVTVATAPTASGDIKVRMFNGSTAAQTNTLYPRFNLVNTGSAPIDLSTVKIRYYYTVDGDKAQNFWCDWSTVGSANVTGSPVKMATAGAGADYYLEVGFTPGAGRLGAGQGIEIQTRVAKSDWTDYTQTGDYSFNPGASAFQDWDQVTGYVSGNLQWGVEPTGGESTIEDLPDECSGSCNAATPVYPTILSDGGLGNVTMYTTAASDGGACNYGTTDVMSFAAMSVNLLPGDAQAQWQGGRICGQCAEVTALTSQGPKSVVVRIMDKCPDAYCGIDLGGSAPGQIMLDGYGRYTGKWRFVSCRGHSDVSDGPPTLDVIGGSNAWWSRVHVRNGPTATDTIEWQDAAAATNGEFPFATDPENAFEVPVNDVLQSGSPSFLITVHYVDESMATVTLSPDQLAAAFASYPLD